MYRLFAFDAGRPGVGMIWITLLGFLFCFGFWACWIMLDGTDGILAGFGFLFGIGTWLDVLMEWIRRRYWKESQWRWIWNMYDTLGGTLYLVFLDGFPFSPVHLIPAFHLEPTKGLIQNSDNEKLVQTSHSHNLHTTHLLFDSAGGVDDKQYLQTHTKYG
ncbi:hypothetical protein B0H13DRAFT_1903892 [Mycena leptocephala]|nr:hypothetical protein B0H13DRAFT_1903892 [Mycena leptocephala]